MSVKGHSVRAQAFSTYFLRNRPQLELIGRLLERSPKTGTLRVAVLGCSTGAEAYSAAWRIRTARPDLKLILQGVDISKRAVKVVCYIRLSEIRRNSFQKGRPDDRRPSSAAPMLRFVDRREL